MNDEDIRRVIMALLGESANVPVTEELPTELVDALRERLRAHDGGDQDQDQNLLAAYLAGELDGAGQIELGNRLLTADDVNARSRQKTAGSGRIGAAPRVYPTPDNEADIAERLRDARRWTNRLEEATLPAPASFADAVANMVSAKNIKGTTRRGFLPQWVHVTSWRPVASIASVALVFIIGINLIRPDLQFQPGEGGAPAIPVERDFIEAPSSSENQAAPETVTPIKDATGIEEVIVTGSRMRRDEFASPVPGQSGGLGSMHSLDTSEFLKGLPQVGGGFTAPSTELDQTQIGMEEVFRLGAEGTLAYNEGRFEEAADDFERAISFLQPLVPADDVILVRLIELRDAAVLALENKDDEPPTE